MSVGEPADGSPPKFQKKVLQFSSKKLFFPIGFGQQIIFKKAKKELGEKVEKIMSDTLQRLNIPTRKEMEELKARLEHLEKTADKKE